MEQIRKSSFWLRGSSRFAWALQKAKYPGVVYRYTAADNSELGTVSKVAPAFHTVPLVQTWSRALDGHLSDGLVTCR